jgi:hypothetical protein
MSKRLNRWRPSELEKLELCACYKGSSIDTAVSAEGTMLHEAMEYWVNNRCWPPGKIYTEEHLFLLKFATEQVSELLHGASGYAAETRMNIYTAGNVRIKGIADLVITYEDPARPPAVIDYKFGRLPISPADQNLQGHAYGLGYMRSHPAPNGVTVIFIQPHERLVDGHHVTRADIAGIIARICSVISRSRTRTVTPTPHPTACQYCSKKLGCTALGTLAVTVAEGYGKLTIPEKFVPGPHTTPEQRNTAQHLAQLFDEWGKMWKADNARAVIEDGVELEDFALRSRTGSRKIEDPCAAWRIASECGVSVEEFLAACSVSVGQLDAVLETKGVETREKCLGRLEDAEVMVTGMGSLYLQRKAKRSLNHWLLSQNNTKETEENGN